MGDYEFEGLGPEFPRTSPGPRRRADETSGMKALIGYVTLAITLISLVFSAGYNWHRVTQVEDNQAYVTDNYLRKDVNQQQMLTIDAKLEEIKSQLQSLQRASERQERK